MADLTVEQKVKKLEFILMLIINMLRRLDSFSDVELDRLEKLLNEGR